ncbi:MAG TPA: hypothetical protein VHN80_10630 [Kineosporiaceae bacterium]|nr:hypothetical protein [Kineosporiaceae bacterium]
MRPGELTSDEHRVSAACPTGEWVDLGGARLRAGVLAGLLLCGDRPTDGAVAAVRVRNAHVTGDLDVSFADVPMPIQFDGCTFDAAPTFTGATTRTLELTRCALPGLSARLLAVRGDLRLADSTVNGLVNVENAAITGTFNLSGAQLNNPGTRALSGGGLVVGGGLFGRRGLTVNGETRLIGARVDGGILLNGASFSNPAGVALCLDDVVTNRLLCSEGFATDGEFKLRSARISGEFNLYDAVLCAPERAIRARGLTAGELTLIPASVQGLVDLTRVQVGALRDNVATWPQRLRLDGFVYDHLLPIGPAVDAAARCRWLTRDAEPYRPQPYEQLAAYYRRLGHDDDARRVLLAKERRRRATVHPVRRAGGYLLDALVGYGYRPWLAGVWLGVLVAVGSVVFSAHPPAPIDPAHRPHLSAVIYTVDLLIPIGAFGLRNAYDPVGATQWMADGLIAAGWILATALVAGISRSLGRD